MRLGDNYRLMPSLHGWDGPPDPPEDSRVFECPCGVLYARGGWSVAHGFEPCPGSPVYRKTTNEGGEG